MSSLIAGKGRTGLAIICTLLMQGYFNDMKGLSTVDVVNSAINFFREKRGDGIENPDQIRFIYQFLQSSDSMGADILLQSSLRAASSFRTSPSSSSTTALAASSSTRSGPRRTTRL